MGKQIRRESPHRLPCWGIFVLLSFWPSSSTRATFVRGILTGVQDQLQGSMRGQAEGEERVQGSGLSMLTATVPAVLSHSGNRPIVGEWFLTQTLGGSRIPMTGRVSSQRPWEPVG